MRSFIISAIICSDSLDAVPFPQEISVTLYFFISFSTSSFDSSTLLCGAVGYITLVSSTFPVPSTTASLQPVLNAGSQPSTVLPSIGGCKSNCSRFFPNTLIAPSSAVSVRLLLISLSIAGAISLEYASAITSLITGAVYSLSDIISCFSKYLNILSTGAAILTVSNFSDSPRLIASILCPGIVESASL